MVPRNPRDADPASTKRLRRPPCLRAAQVEVAVVHGAGCRRSAGRERQLPTAPCARSPPASRRTTEQFTPTAWTGEREPPAERLRSTPSRRCRRPPRSICATIGRSLQRLIPGPRPRPRRGRRRSRPRRIDPALDEPLLLLGEDLRRLIDRGGTPRLDAHAKGRRRRDERSSPAALRAIAAPARLIARTSSPRRAFRAWTVGAKVRLVTSHQLRRRSGDVSTSWCWRGSARRRSGSERRPIVERVPWRVEEDDRARRGYRKGSLHRRSP